MEPLFGRALYEGEVDRHVDYWRYARLLPIGDCLPPVYRQQLDTLAELEKREQREEAEIIREEVTPPPNLQTADIDDIVTFLRKSANDVVITADGPSDRLASRLADAVAANPERFSVEVSKFLDTGPNYIWHILHGFHSAAQTGREFEWESVIELCDQVLRIGTDSHDEESDAGRELGWVDVRQQVAHMLDNMMHQHPEKVPFACRYLIWKLIEQLATDPPPLDQDVDYSSYTDLAMAFLKNTCGRALHASVAYATWVRTNLGEHWQGFNDVAEVKELLEKHLTQSSRAIRAVYGENYTTFAYLDLEWARQNAQRIFPTDDGYQYPLFQAAWLPYIVCTRPHGVLFDILRPQYELAVDGVSENGPDSSSTDDPQGNLAYHIMWLYLVGRIGLDDALLGRFFGNASKRLRKYALERIGRMLMKSDDPVQAEVIQRAQSLWEWRLGETTSPEELAEFGYWYTSGKLPEEWGLEQLREVLGRTHMMELSYRIVERLADIASEFPLAAIQCLPLLLQDRTRTRGLPKTRYVRTILEAAVRSNDTSAASLARDEINRLYASNQADYTDLLKGGSC